MEIIKYRFKGTKAHRYGRLVKQDEYNITIQRLNDTDQFEVCRSAIEVLGGVEPPKERVTKICKTCGEEKPLQEFAPHSYNSYRSYCIPCYKLYVKNHQKKQEYNPIKYLANRERILAKHKRWRDKQAVKKQGGV